MIVINGISQVKEINQYDELGNKVGLWIEREGLTEVYYRDGVRNGLIKIYNRKTGKLAGLGEFRHGEKSGTWYYFDNSSHLLSIEYKIDTNTCITRITDYGEEVIPKYTSCLKNYYPNGSLKEEGRILYNEDMEIDYYKTGGWNYYDEDGSLIRTVFEK